MDYCNSLLLGSAQYQLNKLQVLQNMACRTICQTREKERGLTGDLMKLHWLKSPERIIYKVAMLMFCCYSGTAPPYLQDLVIKEHRRVLRSSTRAELPVSLSALSQVHNASFASMEPRIWNKLPESIGKTVRKTLFKSRLKTYLFKSCYLVQLCLC
jgi:hypothetical protein